MITQKGCLVLVGSLLGIFASALPARCQTAFSTNAMQNAGYGVVDRGEGYRTWRRLTYQTNADQTVMTRTNQVIEVGNSIHRWQTNQAGVGVLVPCTPEFVLTTNGIVGRGGPHTVLLASNCNSYAAVTLRQSDASVLKSHVSGLAYFDRSTGSNLMFATIADSTAQIISNSVVLYPSAFSSVDASIAYRYTRSSFSQEIRFNEMLPDPAQWGLNPESTHLVLITEFVQAPAPAIQTNTWPSGMQTMEDQLLSFGPMNIVPGRAFRGSSNPRNRGIPVAKQWVNWSGRTVLLERLHWPMVRTAAAGLPAYGSSSTNSGHAMIEKPVRWFAQGSLPTSPNFTTAVSGPVQLLAAMPQRDSFVADWETVTGGGGWYFYGGYTFLITEPTWLQYAQFSDGTFVKYADGASLHLSGAFYYYPGGYDSGPILTSACDGDWGDPTPCNGSPYDGDFGPALEVQCSDLQAAQNALTVYWAEPKVTADCNPAVDIVATDPTATKGVSTDTGTFTISRTGGDWSQALAVNFTIGGLATTSDYGFSQGGNGQFPQSVTIEANQGSKTLTVYASAPPSSGATFERNATLTLSASSAYDIGAGVATVWICDPSAVPPAPAAAPGNLVAWWRAENNALDNAVQNTVQNDGGLGNGVSYAYGYTGTGFDYNGTRGGVSIPDATALDFGQGADYSIEAWIRPMATNNTSYGVQSIVDKRTVSGGVTRGYTLHLINGQLGCQIGDSTSGGYANFGPTGRDLRDGQFHHVAVSVVRSSHTGGTLYVDGQPVGTFDPTGRPGSLATTAPLLIGDHADPNIFAPFKGKIDEVGIYNRALNNTEISTLYGASYRRRGKTVAPYIVTQPSASQTITYGAPASFSVVARGGPTLSYQWRKNGANIPGATASTLALTKPQVADSADYSVVVSSGSFTPATSANAHLTVNQANLVVTADSKVKATGAALPTLTGSAVTVLQGDNITVSYSTPAIASSPPGSYGITPTLTDPSGALANYNLTTTPGILTIADPPAITTQPPNVEISVGCSASLTVVAGGTGPLSYQWKKGGTAISGATSSTYVVGSVGAGDVASYTVDVGNVLQTITSASANLTIGTPSGKLGASGHKRSCENSFYVRVTNLSGGNIVGGRFDLLVYFTADTGTYLTTLAPWGVTDTLPPGASHEFMFCYADHSITNYDCIVSYQGPNGCYLTSPKFRIVSSNELVTLVKNTTQILNPCLECANCPQNSPLHLPPQPRWNCDSVNGVYNCSPDPCGPWPTNLPASASAAGSLQRLDNFYLISDPPQTLDISCPKKGFKNVYAVKQWHGRRGFTSPEIDGTTAITCNDLGAGICTAAAIQNTPDAVKYRTINASATTTHSLLDERYSLNTQDSATCSRTNTVDRFSGKLTYSGSDVATSPGQLDSSLALLGTADHGRDLLLSKFSSTVAQYYNPQAGVILSYSGGGAAWTALLTKAGEDWQATVSVDLSAGSYSLRFRSSSIDGSARSSDSEDLSMTSNSLSDTGSGESYQLSYYVVDGVSRPFVRDETWSKSLTATLSDPYTSADVNADCDALLAQWNLQDDIQYPWRADASISRGPLVTYNERGEVGPTACFRLVGASYDSQASCAIGQDLTSPPWPSQAEGTILGAPLPVHGPDGELYTHEPYFNFYHINWRFDSTGRGDPQGFVESYGASSPFPNATQWTDDDQARVWPAGPFWAYGSGQEWQNHFMFRLKDPYITDTLNAYEQGGTGPCLIKCKWAETVSNVLPPGEDFVFKQWKFNFRDFIESWRWNSAKWWLDNVDNPPRPLDEQCSSPLAATPVRFSPIVIPVDQLNPGYHIGSGSYWTYEMDTTPLHSDFSCCQPAVYVQPDLPDPACTNGTFVTMPPAVCDEYFGSLWMGRVDQSTSDAHACDNYVANRNNGVPNTAACEPQIELDLIDHGSGGYETFVAPLSFTPGGEPICDKPDINSLDAYIEVKVPEACVQNMGGVQRFGIKLAGANGETYSLRLSEARIYQPPDSYPANILDDNGQPTGQQVSVQEGAFFPADEIQTNMVPSDCLPCFQQVAVIHENGYYRFVSVFDAITTVRVVLTRDGQDVSGWDYYLKRNTDMADLIQGLESVISESWQYYDSAQTPPVYSQPPPLATPHSARTRGLIARCCSAVFEKVETVVVSGVVADLTAVKTAVVGAQGFVQGFWSGMKNDWTNVQQLAHFLRHPYDTCKAIYEGFRGLVNLGLDGLKQIPQKLLEEYLTAAQKSISWADPDAADLAIYTIGYAGGFICEQLITSTALTIFKAALVIPAATKLGSSVATMMSAVKTGQRILRVVQAGQEVAAKVQSATNLAIRAASQFVKEKTGLDRLEAMTKTLLSVIGCPSL